MTYRYAHLHLPFSFIVLEVPACSPLIQAQMEVLRKRMVRAAMRKRPTKVKREMKDEAGDGCREDDDDDCRPTVKRIKRELGIVHTGKRDRGVVEVVDLTLSD